MADNIQAVLQWDGRTLERSQVSTFAEALTKVLADAQQESGGSAVHKDHVIRRNMSGAPADKIDLSYGNVISSYWDEVKQLAADAHKHSPMITQVALESTFGVGRGAQRAQ